MPNAILNGYATVIQPTFSFASIANNAGRICAVIDNSTIRANRGTVYVQVKSGAAAPTAGQVYKVYLVRRSSEANDIADDGLGTTDAGVSTEPVMAECLGSIPLTASANTTFRKSFEIENLPTEFSIVVWNASGQTVSTTGGDHDLQVQLVYPEIQ